MSALSWKAATTARRASPRRSLACALLRTATAVSVLALCPLCPLCPIAPRAHALRDDDMPAGESEDTPRKSHDKRSSKKAASSEASKKKADKGSTKNAPKVDAPLETTKPSEDDGILTVPALSTEADAARARAAKPAHTVEAPSLPNRSLGVPDADLDELPRTPKAPPKRKQARLDDDDEGADSAAPAHKIPSIDDAAPPEDHSTAWIIAGASTLGALLLVGAGAGGYFLVDALAPKTGSLVVTPR